jgi:hypothetical protein
VAAVLSVAIVLLVLIAGGVAMMITIAALTGLIIGLTLGAVVAGLVLMEHPRRWVVCVRLPKELHRRLSEEAMDHMWSLKAEIINRLQASLPDNSRRDI